MSLSSSSLSTPMIGIGSFSSSRFPLSRRINETLDPCVQLMTDIVGSHASNWNKKGGIYNLAQGIVYWKPPESAHTSMIDALKDDQELHIYSPNQGLSHLVTLIEDQLKHNVSPLTNHRVMITAGANQAYVNCILALMDEDAKAIVFAPYYFNHVMTLQMCCGNDCLLIGPTLSQPCLGWPDLDWLQQQLETNKIRVVTIVNPGNPTGVVISRDHLQRVVDLTRQYGCWLIFDCTYKDFVHDGDSTGCDATYRGCFDQERHVLHIFSFSKSHGLAGYRCGYVAVHRDNTALFDNLNKAQDCIAIGVARLSQQAAYGALQTDSNWVRTQVATLATGRRAVLDALQVGLQDEDNKAIIMGGGGSMYVMAKLPWLSNNVDDDDVSIARRLVADFGLAVIPGSFCGAPGWIRVCYANLAPDQCVQAARRLQDGLQALRLEATRNKD